MDHSHSNHRQSADSPADSRIVSDRSTGSAVAAWRALIRAADSISSRLDRALAVGGVTGTQFALMDALRSHGPMCQREMAACLQRSAANITTVIDTLERRGLVCRQRGEHDRRRFHLLLTDAGRETLETHGPGHLAVITSALEVLLPEERQTLAELCLRLNGEISEESPPAVNEPRETPATSRPRQDFLD